MAMATTMHHLGISAKSVHLQNALLVRDAINMHRSVTTLGCNIFIKRIPGNALNIVIVFSDFMNAFP